MINYNINSCTDELDTRDYNFSDFEDYIKGESSPRPTDKITVQNQGNTPACTRYGLWHIINGNNIKEDESQGISRPEINPADPRLRFCTLRGYSNKGSSLQSALAQAKTEGVIEGYIKIDESKGKENTISQIKKSLDSGYYLYSGSDNGDWTATKKNKTYTIRADGKIVGHAWSIVDYNNKGFIAINSYGPKRGDKGYFILPFDLVDKIYSKYVIIDKNDNQWFIQQKYVVKAKTLLMTLKEFYNISPAETQAVIAELGKRLRIDYPSLNEIK